MMNLALHGTTDHNAVASYGSAGIVVGETCFAEGVILHPEDLLQAWAAPGMDALAIEDLEPAFALEPEVVLLGTGARQIFPHVQLLREFARRGIGCEVMDTGAACRTFNVLASEARHVVAALMPL